MLADARVLVTGAAGFIGSHLVHRLLSKGAEVTAWLRPETNAWRLRPYETRIRIVEAALTNEVVLRQTSPFDVIYHLGAAGTNQEETDDSRMIEGNILGTMAILRFARKTSTRVIAAGTLFEYGSGLDLHEEMPLCPVNEYAASKAGAWLNARVFAARHGIPFVWLRLSSTYGPAQSPCFVIPYTIVQALRGESVRLSGNEATRDFVYVDDVVEAFLRAGASRVTDRAINICSGRPRTVKSAVQVVFNALGMPMDLVAGAYTDRGSGVTACSGNATLARELLDWGARVDFEGGIALTVDWYRRHQSEWRSAFGESTYRSLARQPWQPGADA
jgi:nucleoside-diphosphate-sugar epimerase